jgi:hypothetical protein
MYVLIGMTVTSPVSAGITMFSPTIRCMFTTCSNRLANQLTTHAGYHKLKKLRSFGRMAYLILYSLRETQSSRYQDRHIGGERLQQMIAPQFRMCSRRDVGQSNQVSHLCSAMRVIRGSEFGATQKMSEMNLPPSLNDGKGRNSRKKCKPLLMIYNSRATKTPSLGRQIRHHSSWNKYGVT